MWERNIDWLPPVHNWTRDWTRNLSVFPDWESNLQPFDVQDSVPTNWALKSALGNTCQGYTCIFFYHNVFFGLKVIAQLYIF